MKITVYTVSDCQFSKAEKEYLQSHNLAYEEKNLEQNREWLTEMLAVSNNFAGTPVTKIEKDDDQIVVLKGFTKEEFDEVLGFKKEDSSAPTAVNTAVTPPPQSQPTQSTSTQPTTQNPPTTQPSSINQSPTQPSQPPTETPSTTQPPPPPPVSPINQTQPVNPVSTNPQTTPTPDPLSSVLSDLEQKANLNQTTPPPSSKPPTNIPNIPDFNE